jgi:hypothetical protein
MSEMIIGMGDRVISYYQVRDAGDSEQTGSVVRVSLGNKDIRLEIMAGETTIDDLSVSAIHGIKIGHKYDFSKITRETALRLKEEYQYHLGMQSGMGAPCSA